MSFHAFTGKAEAYAKGRPSYAKQAVEYILSLVSKDAVFADIGAGTGKFSYLIASKGYTLFSVEPNRDMRNQLQMTLEGYENATIIEGTSSATTLKDNSINVIVCAQALHWFDPEQYMSECKRIGKDRFLAVVVYNDHTPIGKVSHRQSAVDRFLNNPILMEFENNLTFNQDQWINFMTSHSSDPIKGTSEYHEHLQKITNRFDNEQINGLIHIEESTKVFTQLFENPH